MAIVYYPILYAIPLAGKHGDEIAMYVDYNSPFFGVIDGFFSPSECANYVDLIESHPRVTATINSGGGVALRPNVRNNTRVIVDDEEVARGLWPRVEKLIDAGSMPGKVHGWNAVAVNERFRFYRYESGQRFAPHHDGAFVRNDQEHSLLTFLVYLNEDMSGGETALLDLEEVVQPKTGRALYFQHPLLHEGCEVTAGLKYVMRTDVMYARPESDE